MSPNSAKLGTASLGSPQGGHLRRSFRAPRPKGQEPLDVLPRSGHQGLGVHLLKPPEPEPPHPVPVLGLPKERLDPHRAFPYGLAVGLGVAIPSHPLQVILFEAAPHPAPLRALRTSALEGTGVAGGSFRRVPDGALPMVVALAA